MAKVSKNQIDSPLIDSKGWKHEFLCSNNRQFRSPSLENVINEEDQLLDFLSMIIVKAFIKKKRNELN